MYRFLGMFKLANVSVRLKTHSHRLSFKRLKWNKKEEKKKEKKKERKNDTAKG